MDICSDMGIEIGTKKSKINPKQQRQVLLLKAEELSWASLNIEGSKLTINVKAEYFYTDLMQDFRHSCI